MGPRQGATGQVRDFGGSPGPRGDMAGERQRWIGTPCKSEDGYLFSGLWKGRAQGTEKEKGNKEEEAEREKQREDVEGRGEGGETTS